MGSSLGEIIKRMAMGANDASAPTAVFFGTVTKADPLEIAVEQKMTLTSEFLILTKNVKDYTVDVTMDWMTENKTLDANHDHSMGGNIEVTSSANVNPNPEGINVSITNNVNDTKSVETKNINLTHNHAIKGRKQITVHNALKVGDTVILLQQQGGLNFVVLDKI